MQPILNSEPDEICDDYQLDDYAIDKLEELSREFFVPQELPIRRVYKTEPSFLQRRVIREETKQAGRIQTLENKIIEEDYNHGQIPPANSIINQPLRRIIDPYSIDIDNITYEELLELEEAIGNVNKGLTQAQIAVNI